MEISIHMIPKQVNRKIPLGGTKKNKNVVGDEGFEPPTFSV